MRVIETRYKGYKFRSRLEARYAVFLDTLGLEWLYENEGFDLDDGDLYLPDFWLPSYKTFLEVKGQHPTDREMRVARKLQFFTGHNVVICYGLPYENDCLWLWESTADGGSLVEHIVAWPFAPDGGISLDVAALVAKQARFEHGAMPPSRPYTNIVNYDKFPF